MENFKKYWAVWLIVISLATTIGGVMTWSKDVAKKLSKVEQIQLEQEQFKNKMLDFVIGLWQISPEQRDKWKKYPTLPKLGENGDTLSCEWIEVEGVERLVKYKMVKDSTITLYVDTLYQKEK